ncbi:hypothetical protein FQV39_07635 [Bosea sp. F3-2]|uniref:hypothetical protein n=1 Tax=Bosea sp. F3-2 TaxID=2599640 RepID=UPI0011ECCED7|nr:hypothetical protein [Bosea sp. F3-2]QEL22451.1 hypothetical protein FQV39_07635 [Bosea sp. F3-2]
MRIKPKARKLVPPEPDLDEQDDNLPDRPMTALEAASFIESMAAELRGMARGTKLETLSYFLEMARIEASAEVERLVKSNGKGH